MLHTVSPSVPLWPLRTHTHTTYTSSLCAQVLYCIPKENVPTMLAGNAEAEINDMAQATWPDFSLDDDLSIDDPEARTCRVEHGRGADLAIRTRGPHVPLSGRRGPSGL